MNQEQTFGQFVRQRRRELDLTQEELARRVGCAAITIRKIEADDARPSVQIAERLAMALAIPLDDRAEFVRRARSARPEPAEIPTPAPALEEIGREDLTGRAIRGYALAEKIGEGGMGAVYRAVQPLVEREVAIKIILPAYANHPDFIRRFEAEAQLVARLEHPHIVPLYDYWREPGIAYLVMRLLRGGSVSTLLQDGALPIETINRLLEQICLALHAAHRIGVIHRDLKPANVLLDEDHNAYLADFGIAKNLGNPNRIDQTNVDMVLGSPAYFSPEQIRSASVRPQTDIYALGVMLYELLTGTLPFAGPTPFDLIQQHIGAPMPLLSARREGLPATLDAVISRAAAKEPQERYPDALALLDDFRRAIGGVSAQPILMPVEEEEEALDLVNPYKGLRAFGEADVDDYFGRETLIQQLLARLGEGGDLARFLAVVGPSGSGKSSVVGAGLVPALRRGALVGSENWFVVSFLPGAHPFEELEAALLRVAVNPPESLLSQLKDGERGLLRTVRRVLPADSAVELVLVIDQFEEVFTLVTDEAERALFLSNLVTAVLDECSRVRVVITLRADFTDRPLRYVDFGELVQRRAEFVLPLTPDELERAIIGPARRVGLRLESGLVSTMIREVGDQPGALPLLQYALTELFEKREGRTLTKAAYETIGGVIAALGRRAEEVYRGLSEADQATARQLFLRLVTLGEGVEDTRRRVLRSELESLTTDRGQPTTDSATAVHRLSSVIDSFGKHRLLTFDRDPITRGPTVEVAHEALLREWPRLREWLNESRVDVRMQRTLADEAAQWNAAQRDASYLLIGVHLEQFEGWAVSTSIALTTDESAFLDASVEERDHQQAAEAQRQQRELLAARQLAETERARAEEQTQAANRLRTRNRALAVAGALVTMAAIAAIIFGGQANASANRADQNAVQAQTNLNIAQANAATAQAASALADQQRAAAVNAQATAEAERLRADDQARLAQARELAAEALNHLDNDPELGILLALQSFTETYNVDGTVLPETQSALHQTVQASRVQMTFPDQGVLSGAIFSPDGKHIATANYLAQEGKVWDLATKRLLYTLGRGDWMTDIAYSPSGDRLATAASSGQIRIFDALSGQPMLDFFEKDLPLQVAFMPDGKRLLLVTDKGALTIWNAQTGELERTIAAHKAAINNTAFSADGTRFATASGDGTAKVWDARTGDLLLTVTEGHSPFLMTMPTISSGSVFFVEGFTDVAFSPDGKYFATSSADGTVTKWIAATGQSQWTTLAHTGGVTGIGFTPDGTRLATAGLNTAKVWNAETGELLDTLTGHQSWITDLDVNSDGTRLLTAGSDSTARIWNIVPEGSAELFPISGRTLAYFPAGKRLAVGTTNGDVNIWDVGAAQMITTLVAPGVSGAINSLAVSPDGTRLAAGAVNGKVYVWGTNGQLLTTLVNPGDNSSIVRVVFTPDGHQVAVMNNGYYGYLWSTDTGVLLDTLSTPSVTGRSVAYSHGGDTLLAFAGSGGVELKRAATGEVLPLHLPQETVLDAAFSPDDQRLAAAGGDGVVDIWDASSPRNPKAKLLLRLLGHTGAINRVVFSPDGKQVATAGADQTVRLWDAATGAELLNIPGKEAFTDVTFSPDGRYLATAQANGTARIYILSVDELAALARTRVTRSLTMEECQKYLHVEHCPAQ